MILEVLFHANNNHFNVNIKNKHLFLKKKAELNKMS